MNAIFNYEVAIMDSTTISISYYDANPVENTGVNLNPPEA
jgi:hypothetical protein